MKRSISFISIVFFLLLAASVNAQVKSVENEVEEQGTNRINNKIDKGVNKGLDKIEDGIGSLFGKKKKNKNKANTTNEAQQQQQQQNGGEATNENGADNQAAQPVQPNVVWSKFDFVPGDEVIFEDGPSTDEENGEFPSRWDLYKGGVEVAEVDGTPVIMFLDDGGSIIPYLKNSNEDYLPEVFTVEMDGWLGEEQEYKRYWIEFFDKNNQRRGETTDLELYPNGLEYGNSSKRYPGRENVNWGVVDEPQWRHISIAYTKGKFKAYMDDTRLINIPRLEGNPTGMTIRSESGSYTYIKNIRIAKGGVKYYDRVLSDGKIVVNGIKFDVNKATLKAESMGPINEIYQLMIDNPTINFSVEGHTDNDGSDVTNMTLSKERGKTVMNKLIEMGIASNRLKYDGFGESKPIDTNNTPEGKANNRRVEFVKFSGNSSSNNTRINSNNSTFDQLDKKTIGVKLESLPDSFNIPMSNNTGIVNGPGTVIIYATSDGNMGKMQILDIDKNDNNKLTIKYVTYNYNGSVHSESNNLEIRGTFTCDLDTGNEGAERDKADFRNGGETIYPYETTILKVLK